MTKMLEVIPFHDRQIAAIREGDTVWVGLKSMVEEMGLDWSAQFRRVKRHPVLQDSIAIMAIPTGHGDRETVVISLEMLPGFLATTAADRIVNTEVRERVILFQREAFRVLFEHFFGGRKVGRSIASERGAAQDRMVRLIEKLRTTREPEARRVIEAIMAQVADELGIAPPVADAIGKSAPDAKTMNDEFFDALATLEDGGVEIDHSYDGAFFAINLPEIRKHFAARNVGIAIDRAMMAALKLSDDPPFYAIKPVCSAINDRTVRCWVFKRLMLGPAFPAMPDPAPASLLR